jgi:hypothetical protein
MIPGEWITGLIVAVIGAVGSVVVAYKKGAASTRETRIKSPVPEVPTRKVMTPPTWSDHQALKDRVAKVEEATEQLRRDQAGQYRELMLAGAEREMRLADKLDGIARSIHARIDELLKPNKR